MWFKDPCSMGSCHRSMANVRVGVRGGDLQRLRVAVNLLNK